MHEIFPPGEFLREELEAREWSQQELADIIDQPSHLINEIISGKRAVTPETARGLGEAFGSSAEYWMTLESQYQLSKVQSVNDHVARKASLHSKFPMREYGYAAPVEPLLMDVVEPLKAFAVEYNLTFQRKIEHPLKGETGTLL